MLRSLFILFSFFVIGLTSCEKVSELTRFDMDYSTSITIPSSTGINSDLIIPTPAVETNSESEFAINDTRKDMIEEITLKKMVLTIESPTDGSFSFLKEITVFIQAEGLAETEIASKTNIQNTAGNQLTLDTTNEDLKEYIKKDKFSLRVKTVTDEVIARDHSIRTDAVFGVDAKVLGL